MTNVIKPTFGKQPETAEPEELKIWVCVCGCKDFMLHENGATECGLCGKIGEGHWTEGLVDSAEPKPAYVRTTVDHGTVAFAKERVLRDANDDDTMILIIGRRDGTIRLWTKSDELVTPEQKDWLRSMMKGATGLMLDEPHATGEKP